MKVISTVVNPIPDEEGFHLMKCGACTKYFLLNPQDYDVEEDIYCPFCGHNGNLISFTESICKDKLNIPMDEVEKITINKNIDINELEAFLNSLEGENVDLDVIEYTIDEFVDKNDLMQFEFICCEKYIKVPYDNYQALHFCPKCKGELLVNHQ